MSCPHCQAINPASLPFGWPIEGGRVYAQVCPACGRVLQIRPRLAGDPPVLPDDLTAVQIARLRFVQWRLSADCIAQVRGSSDGGDGEPFRAA